MAENEEEKAKSEAGPEANEPAAPEVEAEIVIAEQGADDNDDRKTAAGPRGLMGRFSPGLLIFFAFILLSVAAFAVWRVQTTGVKTPATGAPDASQALETQTDAAAPPDSAEPEPAASERAPSPDKILNEVDPGLKTESGAAVREDSQARGLPSPPAPGSANSDLQQAAKDAARRAASEDDGDAIDAGSPEDPGPAIEFRPEETEVETDAANSSEAAANGAAAALRIALAEEKQRAEELAREIDSLRADFRQTLQENEARAEREAAALRAEIAELRTSRNANRERPAAILTMISLSQSVERGEPYAPALETIRRQAPGLYVSPAIEAGAEAGLPTLAELKLAFPPAARSAIVAAAKQNARGPAARLLAEFQNIVTVRPARPGEGGDARAIISRAEHHLERDRLADAAAEIRSLDGAPAAAFEIWLAEAERALEARADLRRMSAELNETINDRSGQL